jgi:thiamine-phosphate pyrophosphorylase
VNPLVATPLIRCLVTDRRRLCRVEEVPFDVARRRLTAQVARAIEAGIDLVLVRERDLDAASLAALVSDLVALTRSTDTRVVVNDRVDVAIVAGADGVHLRGDSVTAESVRRIAPAGFLVGRSVRSVAVAVDAGPVDYLIAGTVFPTASKTGEIGLLGLDGLCSIARATPTPVLAIGGITPGGLGEIAASGAAGIAAIGLFIDLFDRPESRL